ncbi:MAG: lactate racemase domain-containing protein [Verrucomicrobiae bacterium]|nr:lactate racemase domain-containing protein [Verrucomicrobiae bacterium]
MATYFARGGIHDCLSAEEKRRALRSIPGRPQRVLIIPPDHTRLNSDAGPLTAMLYELYSGQAHVDILPAIGTHSPMLPAQLRMMFGDTIPLERFLVHDWRYNIRAVGTVPGSLIREWSEGRLDYEVRVEVSNHLFAGYDLIVSVGQLVPHEVVGIANFTKNIMTGVGGADSINKSHFLGAVYGMERIMGRVDTPVRRLFNYGVQTFLRDLPIVYVLTVMQKTDAGMVMRGLYVGDDEETYRLGALLSQQVNLDLLEKPLKRVLVYLDPVEFKSTWLGNKAIYRTRMAMADGGELVILAPGLKEFGEDPEIDRLIRRYGYRGTSATLQAVEQNAELRANLGAAAHLIHGSSEGRFCIRYCPGPGVCAEEIRAVGFEAGRLQDYPTSGLRDGFNGELFYISNPALGLWALREQFS